MLDLEDHGNALEAVGARVETTDAKRPDELLEAAEGADRSSTPGRGSRGSRLSARRRAWRDRGRQRRDVGAAADEGIREEEPPGASPLHDRDDALLTPHAAWYSEESRAELSRTVSEDVARVLGGETPTNPVGPDVRRFQRPLFRDAE